jgi:hypothetical protein
VCSFLCFEGDRAQTAKTVERQVRASTRDTVPEKYKNEHTTNGFLMSVLYSGVPHLIHSELRSETAPI